MYLRHQIFRSISYSALPLSRVCGRRSAEFTSQVGGSDHGLSIAAIVCSGWTFFLVSSDISRDNLLSFIFSYSLLSSAHVLFCLPTLPSIIRLCRPLGIKPLCQSLLALRYYSNLFVFWIPVLFSQISPAVHTLSVSNSLAVCLCLFRPPRFHGGFSAARTLSGICLCMQIPRSFK